MHEAFRMALYGLVAAASPTVLLATLAVLSSKRGRVNGIVFMVGFILAQSMALLIVYLLGSTIESTEDLTINAYVELAVGAALVVFTFFRPWRRHPQAPRDTARGPRPGSARTKALLEKMSHVSPGASLGMGALFGVGAKRLVITIIAAGSLALSAQSGASAFWLGALYVIIGTLIVWVPVVYSAILGRRAEDLVASVRSRTEGRGRRVAFIAQFIVGIVLVADALGRLLG